MKLCTVCGVVTSRAGSRCTEHARQSNRSRHNALYSTRAWQRLSARVLRAWRGEHGNWCPGYQRPAHPAADLTVDHVVPLAAGGAPFDIANTAVLCRSCNSTKGASTDRGGVAHMGALSSPRPRLRRCVISRDMHVSVDDLWAAWKAWAEDQSQHHGTKQTFGRDLRAVVSGLHVSRPRDGEHKRAYVGLALAAEGNNVSDRGPRGPCNQNSSVVRMVRAVLDGSDGFD